MTGVVFPRRATVQLVMRGRIAEPVRLGGAVFFLRLFATQKNDYQLGPFVTDDQGRVTIDRETCEHFVAAEHESGLMDYAGIDQCREEIEIRLLRPDEISRAAKSRRTVWRTLLGGEDKVFGSMAALLAVYDQATNSRLTTREPLTCAWNGSEPNPSYSYFVDRVTPT